MGGDDAVKMGDEFLELLRGHVPKTSLWKREIHLTHDWPSSRNKLWVCNAAEMLWAYLRGDLARVDDILDWAKWAVAQPFMEGEELTSEEVYRSPIYAVYCFAAMAYKRLRFDVYADCLSYCRADVAFLLLGAGAGPGRKMVGPDREPSTGTLLIGDGEPISDLPFVAQAGMRSLVVNGQGGFSFVNAEGLSVMLAQGVGLTISHPGRTPAQVEMFALIGKMAPGIPPFGFSPADQTLARAFLRNPTDHLLARSIIPWIEPHCPQAPTDFEYVRYVDGTVFVWCWLGHSSSTDEKAFAAWYPDGKTVAMSADDGKRNESKGQRVTEFSDRVCCAFIDGTGPTVCRTKPTIPEAYRVSIRSGVPVLMVPGIPVAVPFAPPPIPPSVGPKPKPKHKRWWEFWR